MSTVKKSIKEEYNRLKKTFEKIIRPKKDQPLPQLVLQPYRNKKNILRDSNLR
jgi:hypothetical protein